MTFDVTSTYPRGYLAEEKIFCQKEELAMIQCGGMDISNPEWVLARNNLFAKRNEFKDQWNTNKLPKL